jgi:GH25 family lysozyme M1 (1,4-beta-N-acetylmuramidase)
MSGIYGADVSTAVSVAQWQALRSAQSVSFGVVRCYRSNGTVDASAPATVNNGWSAQLSAVDVYHFPSLAVGATRQVNDSVNALQAGGAKFGTYWFDVEDGAGWSSSDLAGNAAFLASLVQAAEGLGLTVGIYASPSGWVNIMGPTCLQFARYPLWYAHWETPPNASFSDFVPFGGWTKASRKQFAGNQTSGGVSYDSNWCLQ